jgi:hypothetical protein
VDSVDLFAEGEETLGESAEKSAASAGHTLGGQKAMRVWHSLAACSRWTSGLRKEDPEGQALGYNPTRFKAQEGDA